MASDYSIESKFMSDFWQFRKAFRDPVDKEEFWENLVNESEKLHQKYNNRYLDQLILVCADDIERRAGVNRTDRKEMLMKLVERFCRKDR